MTEAKAYKDRSWVSFFSLLCDFVLRGQVVEKLIRGLAMEDSKNLFSLFEHNSVTDRALESRVIVADVLAKFERYWLK